MRCVALCGAWHLVVLLWPFGGVTGRAVTLLYMRSRPSLELLRARPKNARTAGQGRPSSSQRSRTMHDARPLAKVWGKSTCLLGAQAARLDGSYQSSENLENLSLFAIGGWPLSTRSLGCD